MTDEPTYIRKLQLASAAIVAEVMVGRIPAEDVPLPVELTGHSLFGVAGVPVVGVVLHAPHGTADVLVRYQALFGGELAAEHVPGARVP